MFTVENKRTYYLVDRVKESTSEIGDFQELIMFLTTKRGRALYYGTADENYLTYYVGDFSKKLYVDFDFTGNDMQLTPVEYNHWVRTAVWKNDNGLLHQYHIMRYRKDCRWVWKLKPYMVLDDTGAIVDVRLFDDKVVAAIEKKKNKPSNYWVNHSTDHYFGERLVKYPHSAPWETFRFRCDPVPHIHTYHWHHYYGSHRWQNRKYANEIRPKRRIDTADLWDAPERHIDRCWKSSCKKRHQWEKHIK